MVVAANVVFPLRAIRVYQFLYVTVLYLLDEHRQKVIELQEQKVFWGSRRGFQRPDGCL